MNFIIKEITKETKDSIKNIFIEQWGSPQMVSRGKCYDLIELPGFQALHNERIIGMITFKMKQNEIEIISLDSIVENHGVGIRLLNEVINIAGKENIDRVCLVTSNDNTKAMRFFQKRGFKMKALHLNAVHDARKLKPDIPQTGYDGIPIEHEIEFEYILGKSENPQEVIKTINLEKWGIMESS
ncbi:GNAT family N-acetyltransferase [Scopulibacillus cellulosilyticus]|uniref:GNAT family N-acetyltransferase n=1 Tax=Scopulibacillus cellulosilyticus TaxID=2665665 RepID=A0ABW2Q060_9BACL